jgi:glutamate synthase (NADPH) large chain
VVVLGRTGRNFAAGMSGGIAYVLDELGDFQSVLCNKSGVDLEPLELEKDIDLVRSLIGNHLEATRSPRAEWILENWEAMVSKFVKVFPHEYKRVLGVPRTAKPMVIPAAAAESRQFIHG